MRTEKTLAGTLTGTGMCWDLVQVKTLATPPPSPRALDEVSRKDLKWGWYPVQVRWVSKPGGAGRVALI